MCHDVPGASFQHTTKRSKKATDTLGDVEEAYCLTDVVKAINSIALYVWSAGKKATTTKMTPQIVP